MNAPAGAEPFTSTRQIIIVSGITAVYLVASTFIVGFNPDQVFLSVVFNLLFFISGATRKFVLGFSVFIVYWIIFDYMKGFPNYHFCQVHIEDLYHFEKELFGIRLNGKTLTPNEFWMANGNNSLTATAGLFYLCWIPVPLGFASYLFFKNRRQFLFFSCTFLLVNLLGFIVYYCYPAAPPWYVQQHGYIFLANTHSDPAGLAKFDTIVHLSVFKGIYSKGSNVFAAMPSLHAAYPLVVLYYGLRNRFWFAAGVFAVVTLGIWFSAVYTGHHYITDIIAGILCAALGITLFNLLQKRWKLFNDTLSRYYEIIA